MDSIQSIINTLAMVLTVIVGGVYLWAIFKIYVDSNKNHDDIPKAKYVNATISAGIAVGLIASAYVLISMLSGVVGDIVG